MLHLWSGNVCEGKMMEVLMVLLVGFLFELFLFLEKSSKSSFKVFENCHVKGKINSNLKFFSSRISQIAGCLLQIQILNLFSEYASELQWYRSRKYNAHDGFRIYGSFAVNCFPKHLQVMIVFSNCKAHILMKFEISCSLHMLQPDFWSKHSQEIHI